MEYESDSLWERLDAVEFVKKWVAKCEQEDVFGRGYGYGCGYGNKGRGWRAILCMY